MTAPEPGTYGQPVYAAGGVIGQATTPAVQRGLPGRQAQHLRRNPALPEMVWLTVAEVAAELRVSKMTVYRLIHLRDIASSRVGRSIRIRPRAVDDYLAGLS